MPRAASPHGVIIQHETVTSFAQPCFPSKENEGCDTSAFAGQVAKMVKCLGPAQVRDRRANPWVLNTPHRKPSLLFSSKIGCNLLKFKHLVNWASQAQFNEYMSIFIVGQGV